RDKLVTGVQTCALPILRQYDHLGYAGQDIQYTAIDALPTAVAMRKEIERQEQKTKEPFFRRVLTGLGVDHSNGEVWIALNNNLRSEERRVGKEWRRRGW